MSGGSGPRDEVDRALLGDGEPDGGPSEVLDPHIPPRAPTEPAAALVPEAESAPQPHLQAPIDLLEDSGDGEPAERGEAPARVGIAGGKGTGKSYLFQAMVYRTQAGELSGALTYFLDRGSMDLSSSASRGRWQRENLERFLRDYASWERLEPTRIEVQRWYRLRLGYRNGIFGGRRSAMELEFLDASGEGFFEAPLSAENLKIWREGFLDLSVMVFCLPLWVAFPRSDLTDSDLEEREDRLTGLQQVIGNFDRVRKELRIDRPVKTVLALTWADDGRSALDNLRRRWIEPYMAEPRRVLQSLRRSSGAARYLVNARRVSEALREEFREAPEPRILRIPNQLDLGTGPPWLIPVSAVEGSRLVLLEASRDAPEARRRLAPPVPVHVELPLLVALCDRANALM